MKWLIAIISAVVVPFTLDTGWLVVLGHPRVEAILRPLGLMGDVIGPLGEAAIAALGFYFIVRRAGWRDLERPERQLLVGVGAIYFPVTLYLMFYWGFIVVSVVYGKSL